MLNSHAEFTWANAGTRLTDQPCRVVPVSSLLRTARPRPAARTGAVCMSARGMSTGILETVCASLFWRHWLLPSVPLHRALVGMPEREGRLRLAAGERVGGCRCSTSRARAISSRISLRCPASISVRMRKIRNGALLPDAARVPRPLRQIRGTWVPILEHRDSTESSKTVDSCILRLPEEEFHLEQICTGRVARMRPFLIPVLAARSPYFISRPLRGGYCS